MFTREAFLSSLIVLSLSAVQAYAAPAKKAAPAKAAPAKAAPAAAPMAPNMPMPKTQNLTPQYNAYATQLRSKLNTNWNYPDGKNHVTIQCVLSADGIVSDFQISSSPKSAAAEEAANQAFNQAQPLDSLPGNTPSARLTLTFDSTSSQHESSSNLKTHLEPLGKVAVPVNP
ncbi:MAG: TonB C-terminal domain-containing protein [Candidatus Obscuribacterales bacterium]|nr:TonB C-terminal domain-containing protein [Candidatus Obscuribacterales bacterium]